MYQCHSFYLLYATWELMKCMHSPADTVWKFNFHRNWISIQLHFVYIICALTKNEKRTIKSIQERKNQCACVNINDGSCKQTWLKRFVIPLKSLTSDIYILCISTKTVSLNSLDVCVKRLVFFSIQFFSRTVYRDNISMHYTLSNVMLKLGSFC